MKKLLAIVAVAAVIVTAACNSGGEGANDASASNEQRNETVANVAGGAGTPQDLEAVMHERHERYEEMGRAMKGITTQLKAGSPDVPVIQRHAATIAGFGPQLLGWFPEGTEAREGRRTRAKAEIWSDAATFRAAAQRFEQAAGTFNQAAQTGNIEQIRAALPALRTSCSNCHDRFRGPEHD